MKEKTVSTYCIDELVNVSPGTSLEKGEFVRHHYSDSFGIVVDKRRNTQEQIEIDVCWSKPPDAVTVLWSRPTTAYVKPREKLFSNYPTLTKHDSELSPTDVVVSSSYDCETGEVRHEVRNPDYIDFDNDVVEPSLHGGYAYSGKAFKRKA